MRRGTWLKLFLLWLTGMDLRVTLLAVPPLITHIHQTLHLSETEVGILNGMPVLLLSAAATLGSMVVARLDGRRATLIGLVMVAAGSALRGIGLSRVMLFGMTFLMGIGIAIVQPALPSLVYNWMPDGIGLATAVYSNGLFVGEVLAAALTASYVLPLLGGWPQALAFWSALPLITAILIATCTASPPASSNTRAPWFPDFKDPRTWRLGLIQASSSVIYFGSNAFVPDYLHAVGASHLIGVVLGWLSAGQIPPSLFLLTFSQRFVGRRAILQFDALLTACGLALFFVSHPWCRILGAALLGFTSAFAFMLALAYPPLLAEHASEAARLSAGMFTVGYALAFFLPTLGGWAWDHSGLAWTSLFPVAMASALLLIAPIGLKVSK